jgi:hypothetical protein
LSIVARGTDQLKTEELLTKDVALYTTNYAHRPFVSIWFRPRQLNKGSHGGCAKSRDQTRLSLHVNTCKYPDKSYKIIDIFFK